MVRTRAAISPTGYPHIGTIYQAWFDYAFAKKNKGQFIVRIEDTDKDRTVADAEEKVFAALDWFNLMEDESPRKGGSYAPYRQSERLEIYKKYALELVNKGKAYYCFCSKERLDEMRQKKQKEGKVPMYDKHCRNLAKEEVQERIKKESWVIRLRVPENTQIIMKDELRKEIVFQSNDVDEQVLLKSDGYPTYFLAVVVDDHLMGVTHMVRGEEWLTSSAKIILLYDFL
ncbi:glutamate--tRNA ligase, partial [Candidatus Roizmanbacteria bacterium CG_4_10_14_3_um_filter_33_21]